MSLYIVIIKSSIYQQYQQYPRQVTKIIQNNWLLAIKVKAYPYHHLIPNYYHYKFRATMQETEVCSNCKKEIMVSKAATHFSYCKRNIIKCATCGEMFDKNFVEEHQEEFHLNKQCEFCSLKLKNKDLAAHTSTCNMRPKYCEYCQLNVPTKEYPSHLKACQSRTTQCEICEKSIINKEFIIHKATCKGKQFPRMSEKISKQKQKREINNFEDSLSNFDDLNDFYDRGFKKETKKVETKDKYKKQAKKQENNKSPPQNKYGLSESPKKQENKNKKNIYKSPEQLSREHFYNNYFQNSSEYLDYDQDNQDPFIAQPSFIEPNYYGGNDNETLDISMQEQLIQQTLFQSSKKQKTKFSLSNISKQLPADLLSADIMNSSFYNDILDIEKQKAIQQDLQSKNRRNVQKPSFKKR